MRRLCLITFIVNFVMSAWAFILVLLGSDNWITWLLGAVYFTFGVYFLGRYNNWWPGRPIV